jgi:hypothetical protein
MSHHGLHKVHHRRDCCGKNDIHSEAAQVLRGPDAPEAIPKPADTLPEPQFQAARLAPLQSSAHFTHHQQLFAKARSDMFTHASKAAHVSQMALTESQNVAAG